MCKRSCHPYLEDVAGNVKSGKVIVTFFIQVDTTQKTTTLAYSKTKQTTHTIIFVVVVPLQPTNLAPSQVHTIFGYTNCHRAWYLKSSA